MAENTPYSIAKESVDGVAAYYRANCHTIRYEEKFHVAVVRSLVAISHALMYIGDRIDALHDEWQKHPYA